MEWEFQLLGPLTVRAGGEVLELGAPKARCVLAVLLCRAGRQVPVHTLVDALWDQSPPKTAAKNIQVYVHQLRRRLGDPERIARTGLGYLLTVGDDEQDLYRFDALVQQSGQAETDGDLHRASQLLQRALDIWRGDDAYADIHDISIVRSEARRLQESRLAALQQRLDIDLRLGRHVELVGELITLTDHHPLQERLWVQLMIALYRCGRQVEALETYDRVRRNLAEETGLDPGPELVEVQRAILAAELPAAPSGPPPVRCVESDPARAFWARLRHDHCSHIDLVSATPRMLAGGVADFTGRVTELAAVDAALRHPKDAHDPVPIVTVSGRGGIGKTAFATHAAHRLSKVYDDGLLFASLSGAQRVPVDPDEVLGRFLRALGVPDSGVPEHGEERMTLFRSLLAGRRTLVVLDDAVDEAQVEPLLPGSGTCGVIATSRSRLGGLPGSHRIDLDALPAADGRRLLEQTVGRQRLRAAPDAVQALLELCAGLPLALRIVGARMAARPHWGLADLVERLADERFRLDALCHGDLAVRATFALSYEGLQPPARRLFRLLGLLDLPDFAVWVAAAVLDTGSAQASDLLEEVVDARLIDVVEGRYRFHDLVRVFARERAEAEENSADRTAAVGRALGSLLSVSRAARRTDAGGDNLIIDGDAPRWRPEQVAAALQPSEAALDWLRPERLTVAAAVRQAARCGLHELCWELAVGWLPMFHADCRFDEWQNTHRVALGATEETGNRRGSAVLLYSLAICHYARRQLDVAETHNAAAIELFTLLDHRYGRALALRRSAQIHVSAGRYREAISVGQTAHELLTALDSPVAAADALAQVGVAHLESGDPAVALDVLKRVVAAGREIGSHSIEARNSYWLGQAHLALGQYTEAERAFGVLRELARLARHSTGELYGRHGQGRLHLARGEYAQAREELTAGLAIARGLNDPLLQVRILTDLGELYLEQGMFDRAEEHLTTAADLGRDLHHPLWRARPLDRLGQLYTATGDLVGATDAWRERRDLLNRIVSHEGR
jgi:DNA-binding SARP family transcriptional activator